MIIAGQNLTEPMYPLQGLFCFCFCLFVCLFVCFCCCFCFVCFVLFLDQVYIMIMQLEHLITWG